jgi:polar amino acid transport system substrate-binding protein
MEVTSFSVAPGESLTIPILLQNQGTEEDLFELSVRDLPAGWVYLPSPAIRLAPGARREATLVVQPPGPPHGRAGRYAFVVRVSSGSAPDQAAEVEGVLTVAALEVEGRIGLLLAATEFAVVPGESVTIPLVLINNGLEEDVLQLRVQGLPAAWVTTTAETTQLAPGQEKAVELTIEPPRVPESRAGRGFIKLQVASQAIPGQVIEAQCALSMRAFTDFDAELVPEQIKAGQPGQVLVENQGNVPQEFDVSWQSPNDELAFEAAQPQEQREPTGEEDAAEPSAAPPLSVPPGEVGTVQFTAAPRRRHFFGKERIYPFIARVQSPAEGHKNLSGEVVGPPIIPVTASVVAFLAALGIVTLVVGALLLSQILGKGPAETPQTGDEWGRIRAAGKIVVGTAADYPPFEYYTPDFQLDGFDIALMRQIAARLGIGVEFRDLAFEGLAGALQLNHIDVAIAALSITPERDAVLDFSDIYYVGKDGVLAHEGSGITFIGSAADMAPYRVGVQRSTVYEDWLTSSLIETGLMPSGNLFVYDKGENAVRDLRENRLDLVVGDLLPAQLAVTRGGVQLVGQGLNTQYFGIAMRSGAASLKAEIDSALKALQNEGVVAQLAQAYLRINPEDLAPVPTPTPGPTPTAAPLPPPGCINDMVLVQHLTFDDQNMTAPSEFAPGTPFTKGWRVRNSGTCTWDVTYRLVYVGGNEPAARMGGEPVLVTRQVSPGDSFDFQVKLVAPLQPGTYQGFWQLVNGEGAAFGERVWVGIRVPALATPTPFPTQTPAPGISFTVDRTQIKAGECVLFTWDVQNVTAVYFYAEGEPWEQNGVPGQSNRTVCPPRTTTYFLRVVKPDSAVEVRQIGVSVEPAAGTPNILRFTVDPPYQVSVGQPVRIQWEVQGAVSRVRILRNEADLWSDAPWSGRLEDSPPGAGPVTYAIEASGPGGTSRQRRTVTVVDAALPPTPRPPAPQIQAFAVSPNTIAVGQCVNVTWSVGGGATLVRLKRDGVVVLDNATLNGSAQDCPSEFGTRVYRVEASNAVGEIVSREEQVAVNASGAGNPLAGTAWQTTAYNDGTGAMRSVLQGTLLTLFFRVDGSLDGSAGCNTYSSSYLVQGTALLVGRPNATQGFCDAPEGVMEQESAFLRLLESVATYEILGRELTLRNNAGTIAVTAEQR